MGVLEPPAIRKPNLLDALNRMRPQGPASEPTEPARPLTPEEAEAIADAGAAAQRAAVGALAPMAAPGVAATDAAARPPVVDALRTPPASPDDALADLSRRSAANAGAGMATIAAGPAAGTGIGAAINDAMAAKREEQRAEQARRARRKARRRAQPKSGGPAGGGEHVVRDGDCITSIAAATGHFWRTIWDDSKNAELRKLRKDPNVLLEGDRVHVPPLREKWEPVMTEMRHHFRRLTEPAVIRLICQRDDEPLGNLPYTLEIDGRELPGGETDPEGKIVRPIPCTARRGRVAIPSEAWERELALGRLDPVEDVTGVQQRLNNLGYACAEDGEWDDRCAAALGMFQERVGLNPTGEPDDDTRERLRSLHGS